LAGALPGYDEPALPGGRGLRQICRVSADLPTERKALDHTRSNGQNGRGHPDPGIGREQRHADNRAANQHEAKHHGRFPPNAVGIVADDQGTERAREETGSEGRERQHQAAVGSLRREECMADLDGKEGVSEKVVKLQSVANRGGSDMLPLDSRRVLLPGDAYHFIPDFSRALHGWDWFCG
jgi:hypothetical protein